MPALDYDRIADLYDACLPFAEDLDFWRRSAADARGPVLELMAGTGRISLPLVRSGVRLIAVDSSLAMLAVLHQKLRRQGQRAAIVCADVRALPMSARFGLALWPFNGLSELTSAADRQRALGEAAALLSPQGRLICTLHNPPVRLRTVDGRWQSLGTFPRPGGGEIEFSIRVEIESESGLVSGRQRYREIDGAGRQLGTRSLPVRFALPGRDELEAAAGAAGLEVEAFFGDFERGAFHEQESPLMIWVLRRAASSGAHRERLKEKLLALERRDRAVRAELQASGELFEGYVPSMERVHRENARRLSEILDRQGWPGPSLAGEEGAEAAWMVAQHAISLPAFQRRCLELLAAAVEAGEAPPRHLAYLTDRVRFNQRRPQVYGTILDWDEDRQLSPWQIENPEGVEERRASAGLPPLSASVREARLRAQRAGERPPQDPERRQRQIELWARKVGWLPPEG